MANKDATERRVYVLPSELLDRIRAYQSANGIGSEVEAARRLLDAALQMRDTIEIILNKLGADYKVEQDIRVLARNNLVTHPLVETISIGENVLEFKLRNGSRGSITTKGVMQIGDSDGEYMQNYPPYQPKQRVAVPVAATTPSPSWEPSKGGDLDDEIPF